MIRTTSTTLALVLIAALSTTAAAQSGSLEGPHGPAGPTTQGAIVVRNPGDTVMSGPPVLGGIFVPNPQMTASAQAFAMTGTNGGAAIVSGPTVLGAIVFGSPAPLGTSGATAPGNSASFNPFGAVYPVHLFAMTPSGPLPLGVALPNANGEVQAVLWVPTVIN